MVDKFGPKAPPYYKQMNLPKVTPPLNRATKRGWAATKGEETARAIRETISHRELGPTATTMRSHPTSGDRDLPFRLGLSNIVRGVRLFVAALPPPPVLHLALGVLRLLRLIRAGQPQPCAEHPPRPLIYVGNMRQPRVQQPARAAQRRLSPTSRRSTCRRTGPTSSAP